MSDLREQLKRESEKMVRPQDFADRMFERGRRRERTRRATALGIGAALFVVVLGIIMSALPDADREPRPAKPTPTSPRSVAGLYTVRLPAGDGDARRLGMNGTYTMSLNAAGEMSLSSPRRFDLPGGPITFDVTGDELTTDLFVGSYCSTSGTYRWALEAGSLILEPRQDLCEQRSLLLASRPWTVDPPQTTSDRLQGDWTATFSCEEMVRTVRRAPIAPDDFAFWARGVGEERGADDLRDPCKGERKNRSSTRFGSIVAGC
jgi:hypothetical protein